MRIRPLTMHDEPFLWKALYHAIYVPPDEAPLPPEIIEEPEIRRYVVGWMEKSDVMGFVAVQNETLIGAVWLRCWSEDDRGYGFVDEKTPELTISLLPGYRGRGIGTTLLRHLLMEAEKRYASVSLSVSASNPARRLYEREGFKMIGNTEGDSITMVKRFVQT